MRFGSVRLAGAVLSLFLAAQGALLAAAQAPTETARSVVIRADQVAGRFNADRYTGISLDGIYGQITSGLGTPALDWVRATNGVSYIRCPAWLGDGIRVSHPDRLAACSVVRQNARGEKQYEWERLERVLDTLLQAGVKPIIVCGGLPDAMLEPPILRTEHGAAVNHPKELAAYADLVTQMMRRLVKTYGAEEVRSWYFEVWAAPDHEGGMQGGRIPPFEGPPPTEHVARFTALYDRFVAAVDAVDPRIRVGGPSLAGDLGWLRLFLEHCARGTNSAAMRKGTRLDFISWQRFGTSSDIARWNADLRKMVREGYPELKGVRFLLTDSGAGTVEGQRANTHYEAARQAALVGANEADEHGGMDLILRTGDLVDDHFDGFRPLITLIGNNTVPLPIFRLNMMLAKMGTQKLKVEASQEPGLGVVAASPAARMPTGAVQVLVYRYDPSLGPGAGTPLPVKLRIAGLPPRALRLPMRLYHAGPQSASPYDAWLAADRPRPAAEALGAQLLGTRPFAADNEKPNELPPGVFVNSGEAVVELTMAPNSVTLVTLGAEPQMEAELSGRAERLSRASTEFASIAATLQEDKEKGVRLLQEFQKKYADTSWREDALQTLLGVYELDLKSPADAESTRKALLALPLDDIRRLRLLERLRVDAIRKNSAAEADELTRQINAIEVRLVEMRRSLVRSPRAGLP